MVAAAAGAAMAFHCNQQPIVLRTFSPISIDHGFHYLRLFIPCIDPGSAGFRLPCHPVDQFCHHLTRIADVTASSDFFVAFPYGNSSITVVFPAEKKALVHSLLQGISLAYWPMHIKPECVEEGTIGPGLVMQESLTHGLKKALVRDGWTVFDDNVAVQGKVTDWQDDEVMGVVAFSVQNDAHDRITFFLLPNVVRFRPLKIKDMISEPFKRAFEDGREVVLQELQENLTLEEVEKLKCVVLPSMKEGFITGCCKFAPRDVIEQKLEDVSEEKHGLMLPNETFYVRVCFPYEDDVMGVWTPSSFVLKSPGLILAPPSIRNHKAFQTLETFVSCISGLNLFGAGNLRIDSASIEGKEMLSSNWSTPQFSLRNSESAAYEIFDFKRCFRSLEVKFQQNFRRPKSNVFHDLTNESVESSVQDRCERTALSPSGSPNYHTNKETGVVEGNSSNMYLPNNLRQPVFRKRKHKGTQSIQEDDKEFLTKGADSKSRKHLGMNSKSLADDNLEARDLPNQKILQPGQKRKGGGKDACVIESRDANEFGQSLQTTKMTLAANHSRKEKKTSQRVVEGGEGNQGIQSKGKKYLDSKRQAIDPFTGTANEIASVVTNHVEGVSISSFSKENEPLKNRSSLKPERPTESKAIKQTAKKSTVDIDTEINQQKIWNKFAEGKLNDLTVPELKCFLNAKKSKIGGRKEELIQRVLLILRA